MLKTLYIDKPLQKNTFVGDISAKKYVEEIFLIVHVKYPLTVKLEIIKFGIARIFYCSAPFVKLQYLWKI